MSNGYTFAAGEGDWRDRVSSGFKIYKLLVDGPWPSRETLIGDAREESRFRGAARALRHAARTHHVDIDCKYYSPNIFHLRSRLLLPNAPYFPVVVFVWQVSGVPNEQSKNISE